MSEHGVELSDQPASWPVESSTQLYRDSWILGLRADVVRRPGQTGEEPFRRLVVEHPGSAVVLAVDEQERALVLRQYRHATAHRLVELPAGVCDEPGEDPLEVARRELREEAELQATEWTHLFSTYSSPGYSAEVIHYYLARGLSRAGRGDFVLAHEEADLEVGWAPVAELVDAVLAGRIADGPVVQAVLAYHARGSRAPGLSG